MEQLHISDQLGRMAARSRAAFQTLLDREIDFFCQGHLTLQQACDRLGLDAEALVGEIRSQQGSESSDATSWDDIPLSGLVAFIIEKFHRPLQRTLPRLLRQVERVCAAGGNGTSDRKSPSRQACEILQTVLPDLATELNAHLAKEENVLFPWILQGNGRTAGNPIRVMQLEHDSAAAALRSVKEATNGHTLPGDASSEATALYESLRKLDRDLREHIHLENNILFPRALSEWSEP